MRKVLFSIVACLAAVQVFAQTPVRGTVRDESGKPLAGVYVLISGTRTGTTTDADGNFTIDAKSGQKLEFSFLGMLPTEYVVSDAAAIAEINMKSDMLVLEDVVVVGYGVTRKRDLAGSVASIKADDVKAGNIVSTAEMLRGRAAGVSVRQQSFEPGGGITVRVRGASSFASNNDPLYVVDGVQTGAGNELSPEDIESIEVLKDASSTAIYGARGANGVVIITTKKGRAGSLSVDYSYTASLKKMYNPWDLTDAQDLISEAMRLWEENGSSGDAPYSDYELQYKDAGTDWVREMTRNSTTQTHSVNVQGGNQKVRAAASFIDTMDKGIVINSDFHRFSSRINVDFDITKWLRLGISSYTVSTDQTYIALGTNNTVNNAIYWMLLASPLKTPRGVDVFGYEIKAEPVYNEIMNKDFKNSSKSTYITVYGDVDIAPWLNGRVQYTYNDANGKTSSYFDRNTIQGQSYNGQGEINNSDSKYMQLDAYLTARKAFGRHHVKLIAGTSRQEYVWSGSSLAAHGFTTDAFSYNNMGAASTIEWIGSNKGMKNNISFFTRAEYVINDKYIFNASFRADGASNFGNDSKWGYFPSCSAAWHLGDEPFMAFAKPVLSSLKLRASYGQTGNDGIGSYESKRAYSFINVYLGNETIQKGMRPWTPGNPALKWETTAQTDFGVDFTLFDNKVEVNADWYNKVTTDLLNDINLSTSTTGIATSKGNNGKIRNRGWELFVKYRVFDNKMFSWSTTLNMSQNRNTVIDLGAPTFYTARPQGAYEFTEYCVVKKGLPLSSIYGYVWDGIIQEGETYSCQPASQPGDPKFKDLDGDGVITSEDRQQIGSGEPDLVLGWGNSFKWKDLDFSFFFDASCGNDLFNLSRVVLEDNNRLRSTMDRWTRQHPSNDMIRGDWTKDGGILYGSFVNSRFVEDASFIRLSNIEIGYTLPFNRLGIRFVKNLRVFLGAQRLFTITRYSGFDPEVSVNGGNAATQGLDFSSYPSYRQFNAGAKITF